MRPDAICVHDHFPALLDSNALVAILRSVVILAELAGWRSESSAVRASFAFGMAFVRASDPWLTATRSFSRLEMSGAVVRHRANDRLTV